MKYNKVCVIHLNQIGDLVFSLPLLQALRSAQPEGTIHSVVKPYLRELLEYSPLVDAVLERPSGLRKKLSLFKRLRAEAYDLMICLSGSEECLAMTAFSKARVTAGFTHFPLGRFLDVQENIEGHPCWYNNAKLLKRLSIPVAKNDYVGLLHHKGSFGDSLPERFCIVSPGASARRQTKTWVAEKFAGLIIRLQKEYGLTAVLVGSRENRDANKRIETLVQSREGTVSHTMLNLTGRIGLGGLCAVLERTALFVGIDSGVMHLASALDVPVVGLFGPTDPGYVGPQNTKSRVVRLEHMGCVPCYLKKCRDTQCMKNISVEEVFSACKDVLHISPPKAPPRNAGRRD